MTTQTASFKINGFTDAHTQCDRCGKNELKGTYNITTGTGDSFYLGSSCIKKAYQMSQKEFSAKVTEDYLVRKSLAKAEFQATSEYKAYVDHYSEKKINGIVVCQFEIDREISLEYAMRIAKATKPIKESLAAKYCISIYEI